MRLYLAVAVLMLAFVACTEAQEDSMGQRLTKFGEQVTELGRNLGEKVKGAVEKVQTNEFVVSSRDRIREWYNTMRTNIEDLIN
ncbi:apolipoprotein C-I [Chelmon rostratus]|uniref:apolipoprotein C-I n=1 Tax=Chelmon rostratus TaxID=109905 RepID=UPI001BEC9C83|nr:apolipoprotein C-I [Chelmon rostratus]